MSCFVPSQWRVTVLSKNPIPIFSELAELFDFQWKFANSFLFDNSHTTLVFFLEKHGILRLKYSYFKYQDEV